MRTKYPKRNICTAKDYTSFLNGKRSQHKSCGFRVEKDELNEHLFDWQKDIVQWAIKKGRAALFEDCGLGKTIQQIEWGYQIHKKENKPILILAPLAVAEQTVLEGKKFGIDINICTEQNDIKNGLNISNYEKLHKFDVSCFAGVVLDESSILKSFSGVIKNKIIDMFAKTPYKLACTATPAPNDWTELGNHCEFLGVMSNQEMKASFFINDTKDTGNWRLKGHVKNNVFWGWVCEWAMVLTKPSDIGYSDTGFILPKITYHEHIIKSTAKTKGHMFVSQVSGMNERRSVRKETIGVRCRAAAELINTDNEKWVVWCNLNEEGVLLNRLIENSEEVAGRHSDLIKTTRMIDFANGKIQRLITKPKIGGMGMNWQVCHNAAFIGLNDSWESLYQAIRRIWRFGQAEETHVHIFIEEREGTVLKNIKLKDKNAQKMIDSTLSFVKDALKKETCSTKRTGIAYNPTKKMEVPGWMR